MKSSLWILLFSFMMLVTARADEIHLECWIENHPHAGVTPAPSHGISIDLKDDALYLTEQGSVIQFTNKKENTGAVNDEQFVVVSPTIIKYGRNRQFSSSKFEDLYEEGLIDRTNGQYKYGYGKSAIDIPAVWTGLCKKANKTQF